MTAFEIEIDPKDLAGAVAVDRVNQALLKALSERMRTNQITKSDLARKLGVDRSVVSRWLRGNQNITPRTLGEILWALEYEFDIVLHDIWQGSENAKNVHSKLVQSSKEPGRTEFQPTHSPPAKGSKSRTDFVHTFDQRIGTTA